MHAQYNECELRSRIEGALPEVNKDDFDTSILVGRIVELLVHRIGHEGLPEDAAVQLAAKWVRARSDWDVWVNDHSFSEQCALGNGWVRSCRKTSAEERERMVAPMDDEQFVRTAMGRNLRYSTDLCPLLDTLEQLMPLPHHADKVSRMMGWLETARKRGLISMREEWDVRERLVAFFF